MVVICYACCILNSMEGWEAGIVGFPSLCPETLGMWLLIFFRGTPFLVGLMIVFMATKHMMGYMEKKNKPSTIYARQGRKER